MAFLLFILLVLQSSYYLYYFYFFNKKSIIEKNYQPTISIIICAKNEVENLKNNLPKIALQNYPDFEIIVIDDNSDDDTPNTLEQLKKNIPNLKSIKINAGEKIGNGKKHIISKAVEFAKNEVLVFTDADCFPASKDWLRIMSAHLYNYSIVLGVAPLVSQKNNLVAWVQNYETAQTALQYLSSANAHHPYMAVGRNMMMKKAIYLQNNWTQQELTIASGDDDLLIQKIATSANVNTCTAYNTFMFSPAKKNYSAWVQQKIRHFSTGFFYKQRDKLLLGIFLLSKTVFYFFAFYNSNYFIILLYILAIQFIYFSIEKKYKIKTEWQKIILLDFILVLNSLILGLANQFKLKNKWK